MPTLPPEANALVGLRRSISAVENARDTRFSTCWRRRLMFKHLHAFFSRRRQKPISDWCFVTFDDQAIHVRTEPPGRAPWSIDLRWASITRVCFQANDLFASDEIYLFTASRPESWVVPTEASGGGELWQEIIHRGLFDPELAIQAASSTGGVFCWPSVAEQTTRGNPTSPL